MTAAYGRYLERNVVFATSALVSKLGCQVYATGNFTNESKEICERDAPKADGMLHHLLFASTVDNFNCFLSEVLVEVLEKDPRPISGRKFAAKDAFLTEDIESLRKNILERFVLDLGYQNIEDLTSFLENNFGLVSLSHWLTKLRLNRLIQIRNIITHNRGTANLTYLARSKSKRDTEGATVWVQNVLRPANYLNILTEKLDEEIDRKFFGIGS